MAASHNEINVIFGAQIAGLVAGVAESKEAIESLRAPIDSFVSSLSGIAEAVGAAFAVEKIVEFAKEMAELGEKTLNSAYILGQSTEEYARLSGALRLTGVDADSAQKTMERLGKQVQSALIDPTGKAAIGFKNLHLSTEEVREGGQSLTTMLSTVIERFQELAPNLQNTGALMEVLGLRGGDKLAGALRAGAEGFKEALDGAKDYAQALSVAAPAMDNTAEGLHRLSLDTDTLKNSGFLPLKSIIDDVVSGLDDFVKGLTAAIGPIGDVNREMSGWEITFRVISVAIKDVINIFGAFANTLNYIVEALKAFADTAAEIFFGISRMAIRALAGGDIENAYNQMLGRLEAITVSRGAHLADLWQGIVNNITSVMSGGASDRTPFESLSGAKRGYIGFSSPRGEGSAGTDKPGKGGGKKEGDDRLAEWRAELQDKLVAEHKFFADSKAEELAFWQQKLALVQGGGKEDVKLRREIGTQIFNLEKQLAKQSEQTALEQIGNDQKIQDERFSRYRAAIQGQLALGKINGVQEVAQERQLADEKWLYDQAYFDKKIAAATDDLKTQQKLNDEKLLAEQKYVTQVEQLHIQAALAAKTAWDNIISPIKSAIANAAIGVAQGTQTLAQAIGNIDKAIFAEVVNKISDKLFSVVGDALIKILPDAMKDFLGLGSDAALATASAALDVSATALTATSATLDASGIALDASAVALTGAASALTAAAAFKAAVPFAAKGWQVPSFAAGGIPSILHSNEMVLPADISQGLQSAIRGGSLGGGIAGGGASGGHTFNLNISAWDGKSVMNAGPALVASINRAMRNGSQLRTA